MISAMVRVIALVLRLGGLELECYHYTVRVQLEELFELGF